MSGLSIEETTRIPRILASIQLRSPVRQKCIRQKVVVCMYVLHLYRSTRVSIAWGNLQCVLESEMSITPELNAVHAEIGGVSSFRACLEAANHLFICLGKVISYISCLLRRLSPRPYGLVCIRTDARCDAIEMAYHQENVPQTMMQLPTLKATYSSSLKSQGIRYTINPGL